MVKVSLFMNLKNEKMDKAELLKNRLQASIDFAVKMNEDFEASSWNHQEGVLLNHNEAKLVVELIKKLTLTDVSQQRELLLAYEQSKCPETWWMSKNQAENEVNDFIANNCG